MIAGLTDAEKIRLLHPLFGDTELDSYSFPKLKKVSESDLDFENLHGINIQNLSPKKDNRNSLVFAFRFDKDLRRYSDDPRRYIPLLLTTVKCKIKCANYCNEKVTISCSGWGIGEDTFHGKCLLLYPRA